MKEDQRIYQERIVTDPRILAGKPVVKGTRIAVDLVLEELSHNPDIEELLAAHPDLTRTDVQACLAYAQALVTGKYHDVVRESVEEKARRDEEQQLAQLLLAGVRSKRGVEVGSKEWREFRKQLAAHAKDTSHKGL